MLCNQMQQTCCRHSVVRQIKEVTYTLHTTAAASNYCSCCDSAGILEDTCALCISSISFPGPSEQAGRPPRARHGFGQAGEVRCGEHGSQVCRAQQQGEAADPQEVLSRGMRVGCTSTHCTTSTAPSQQLTREGTCFMSMYAQASIIFLKQHACLYGTNKILVVSNSKGIIHWQSKQYSK